MVVTLGMVPLIVNPIYKGTIPRGYHHFRYKNIDVHRTPTGNPRIFVAARNLAPLESSPILPAPEGGFEGSKGRIQVQPQICP